MSWSDGTERLEASVAARRIWCAVLGVALGLGGALAQEPRESSASPEQAAKGGTTAEGEPTATFQEALEVVAPPIVEDVRVTPFAVEVTSVGRRQVEEMAAGDLPSALRRVPGVTISRFGLVGSYGGADGGAVFIRGQGSGRPGAEIGTFVDGVPRVVPVWTHPVMDALPADAVDRIDVYKSAQPVLLGNMAFAAVDLVPKRLTSEGTATRVAGSLGEYATRGATLEHGAKHGALDYYLLGSIRRSDGHRQDSAGRVETLYGRVGYELAAGWGVSLQVHGTDSWADDPGSLGAPARGVVPRFALDETLVIATLAEAHGAHRGTVKLYHDGGTIDWLQWDAGRRHAFTTVTDFSSYGVRARESFSLPSRTELVVGIDHDVYGGWATERRPTGSFRFPDTTFRNTGAYGMVARTFGSATELTPSFGVRYTRSADFGGQWGGQAGVVLRRGATSVHANLLRAFNLPGVFVVAMYAQWGAGERWQALGPETLNHGEVGVAHRLGEGAGLRLVVFKDRVRDALRFVPPPPPPPSFANVGDYTIQGAEFSLTLTPHPTASLFAGATFLDPSPDDVPNAPRRSYTTGVSWRPGERLRLGLDAEWLSRQAVLNPRFARSQAWIDGYALLNATVTVALPEGTGLAGQIVLAGENLTGADYEYRPGYPAPGRVLSLGVDLRF